MKRTLSKQAEYTPEVFTIDQGEVIDPIDKRLRCKYLGMMQLKKLNTLLLRNNKNYQEGNEHTKI